MLCEVYRAEFCMKNKYRKKASMNTDYLHWLEDIGLEEYCMHGFNRDFLNKHNKRHHFYFSEWKQIGWNFDPEDFDDMKWLMIWCGHDKKCIMTPVSDWYPIDRYSWTQWFSVNCFKVIYNGQVVDMAPYIEQFYEERKRRWNVKEKQWKEQRKNAPPYCYYIRHPHTTNEMRQSLTPEDKRTYQKEYAISLQERGRRKQPYLPSSWDEKPVNVSRSWKDRTKQKHQYKSKSTRKRRRVRGHIL